ncbi:LOW QUALITY PROTEIN: olfactory receptor 52B4-like [Trichechus inunguis]
MAGFNYTAVDHMISYLLGIPGQEDLHTWISISLFISYVFALLGNGLLVFIILTKSGLHEPIYLFLCMLAGVDIVFATTTEPKVLTIFWCNYREISLIGYIAHLCFQLSAFISESGILLIMTFDRYIAVRYPLRYTTIVSHSLTRKIGVAVFLRAHCIIFLMTFHRKRLTFCRNNILPHTFCKHIGLAKYGCDDICINTWYGFFILMFTVVFDVVLIFASYVLILHTVFHIPSQDAHYKAFNTCGSHVCVMILFYGPGIFSVLKQCFGLIHVHILLASTTLLAPPMLNSLIYGVKTKQMRDQVVYVFSPKQK